MNDSVVAFVTALGTGAALGSLVSALALLHRRARTHSEALSQALAERAARRYIVEVEYADGHRETIADRPAPKNAKRRATVEHAVRELESA